MNNNNGERGFNDEPFERIKAKLFAFGARSRVYLKTHPLINRLLKIFLGFFALGLAVLIFIFISIIGDIPSEEELHSIRTSTASEVYSADSVLLGKYYIEDRTPVAFTEISPYVTDALIATEDKRFFKHSGIDKRGLMRVFFKTILLRDDASGGGSTISQQLAKNLYPRKKYLILSLPINKVREAITARHLEKIYSKKDILTLYLNTVSFGDNAFGIESAAKRFFNKTAAELKAEEAAVLVGLLKATTAYNPRRNPNNSTKRRNVVLGRMAEHGYLHPQAADSLKKLPITLDYTYFTHNEGLAPYFREHIRQELQKWCKEHTKPDGTSYNLYTDGLRIYTTINSKLQQYAEEAVRKHMAQLQRTFFAHWGKRAPWGKNKEVLTMAKQRSRRYLRLKEAGLSEKEITEIFNKPVKMTIFSWKGPVERDMTPMDSIRYYQYFLHAGFLAMEAETGNILAWVGGIDHNFFKYDHVNMNAKRQAGSTFKPIVYTAALESGIPPCDYIPNEQTIYEAYQNWSPRNANNEYGGEYSMQGGLRQSVNVISARLIMEAGIHRVIGLARKMGIISELPAVPSLALGTADMSLMELVGAYSTFANRGYVSKPSYLLRIADHEGKTIKNFTENHIKGMKVISSDNADIMVHMLQDVAKSGTAVRLRSRYGLYNDIGGKTGTTQSQSDGWFVGFTPALVAGAWVGAEDRRIHFRSLSLGSGSNMALPIWAEFMVRVNKDKQFNKYTKVRFREPSPLVLNELDCEPVIYPQDTLMQDSTLWQYFFNIFDGNKTEEEKEKIKEQQEQEKTRIREQREQEKRLREEEKQKRKQEREQRKQEKIKEETREEGKDESEEPER